MSTIDRIYGTTGGVAVKAPCAAATTANITLSGLQTIDGVALAAKDRVLVKDQTNAVNNGIWIVAAGAWTRAPDFDGTLDVVQGSTVFVINGATNGSAFWRLDTAFPVIGTSSLAFARTLESASSLFTQTGTGAVARSVEAKLRDVVSVKDFGAVGDAVTDDTTAIQNALNTGRCVLLPKGIYKVTAALTVTADNTGLYGEGKGSVIAPTAGNRDVFTIGNGATEISGLRFENFTVWPSGAMTGGYVFNCRYSTDSLWSNVRAGAIDSYVANGNVHRLYSGYYFDRFSQNVVLSGEIVVAQDGIKARGNADQSFGAELSIDDGIRIVHGGGKGVWLGGGCGGVYLGRVDISQCRYGLYCDSTLQSGTTNREVFLHSFCTIDNCTGWGINLEATSVALLEVDGAWISGCGSAANSEGGIRVAPSAGVSARWSNLRVNYCYYDGVVISDGAHVFSGGFIRACGTGTPGGCGIHLSASSQVTVTGMMIHGNGNSTRGYGIRIEGTVDNYNIQSNAFFSNGQASIYQPSGPSNTQIIRDNRGWVTENNGTATITTGNTTVVVNHGLADTPTFVDVGFAGPMDATDVYVYAAPGSFTSTQFTITYSQSAGSNRSFWWRATRGAA